VLKANQQEPKSKNQKIKAKAVTQKKTPLRMRHSPLGVAVLSTSFIANATAMSTNGITRLVPSCR
jgi:hypothetical protein